MSYLILCNYYYDCCKRSPFFSVHQWNSGDNVKCTPTNAGRKLPLATNLSRHSVGWQMEAWGGGRCRCSSRSHKMPGTHKMPTLPTSLDGWVDSVSRGKVAVAVGYETGSRLWGTLGWWYGGMEARWVNGNLISNGSRKSATCVRTKSFRFGSIGWVEVLTAWRPEAWGAEKWKRKLSVCNAYLWRTF